MALGSDVVAAEDANGRILAEDISAERDLPPEDIATVDGYAVRAADTEGASAYNPLPLDVAGSICAGLPLPSGSDAVLPFEAASRVARNRIEVLEAAAPGEGIARRGSLIRGGDVVLRAGRRLRPQDVGLLRLLGIERVSVRRRPRVRLAIAGPKGAGADALGPMLLALVGRDGGTEADADADAVLIAGRSSVGRDDDAASRLAQAGGTLALHGIALRPGASSGLGHLGSAPVLLLPGDPLACLTAYELLAGRLIRGMAGLPIGLPHRIATLPLARKIVSAIGFTDMVQVAVSNGTAAPVASVEGGGLPAACRADGFVVVPEASEGHAEGEAVQVRLYESP